VLDTVFGDLLDWGISRKESGVYSKTSGFQYGLNLPDRYCNVDFVFWCTMQDEEYLSVVISYDISCQWSRNFWKRMEALNPDWKFRFTDTGVRFLVPKFHLRAHQPECHTDYNFDYAPGCGETHGETIEEGWAQSNKAAAQTKEMGPGTRAQTLDDIFGFHNFRNILYLGVYAL
jgi:hypothetical protein